MPQLDTPYARLTQLLCEAQAALTGTDLTQQETALRKVELSVHAELERVRQAQYDAILTNVLCCECGRRVINKCDYLRLKLCVMCMCFGLIAYCVTCGENYPEHHPGGRGCATFVDPAPGESHE